MLIGLSAWPSAIIADHHLAKPNIVFILADDLGYGDVACCNPESKVPTPHIDRLAKEDVVHRRTQSLNRLHSHPIQFSHRAHGVSKRNARRVHRRWWALPDREGPADDRQHAQEKGYTTALYGKQHVGLTFFDKAGKPI